jgi:hypothetical protein
MSRRTHWQSEDRPTTCDVCGKPLASEAVFIDGVTVTGLWAIMCNACHILVGKGFGLGVGQMWNNITGEKIKG